MNRNSILCLLAGLYTCASVPAFAQSGPAPAVVPAASAAAGTPPALPPSSAGPSDAKDISALVGAEDDATLSSQMAGRIRTIRYGIGQPFPAGAVLVEFDCAEQEARLQSAQAELLGMRETHLTKLRLQGLGAAGELEVTMAAAAAEKAKSQVRQQEVQMAFCKVKAPYPGRVARLRAKAHENVALGQPLMEIVANAKLKVSMHVPSSWIGWIKPGTPVSIRLAETGQEHPAKVSKVNSRVDGVSQSIEIEARFDGKTGTILPGMIGAAQFPTRPN
ncbi:MAG TPA: efflux RND transporter periplasmic adaptor subunit [Noviherbaspirillum sp.]|uniref:efflux RND transporter periplasmic adaptor subunit n=1 Tax=Noviherbaspirillum sp. TaxID=1926288 RepID=UPI002D33B035|nr:efflux RND transporter periplasmic adaptor subunit [Noviherbaspirillum sp.]HYD97109.1 efflux RND transporter periplasmic adaptor subunit [Noviherbaspirillum sp.]